jgi:hypothetical protein
MNSGLLAPVRAGTPAADLDRFRAVRDDHRLFSAAESTAGVSAFPERMRAGPGPVSPAHPDAACPGDPARFPGHADAGHALSRHLAIS